jgi:hypothetical protein
LGDGDGDEDEGDEAEEAVLAQAEDSDGSDDESASRTAALAEHGLSREGEDHNESESESGSRSNGDDDDGGDDDRTDTSLSHEERYTVDGDDDDNGGGGELPTGAISTSHRQLLREWQADAADEYEDGEDAGYYRVEVSRAEEPEFLSREVEGWAEELEMEMHAAHGGGGGGGGGGAGRGYGPPAVGEDPEVTGPSSHADVSSGDEGGEGWSSDIEAPARTPSRTPSKAAAADVFSEARAGSSGDDVVAGDADSAATGDEGRRHGAGEASSRGGGGEAHGSVHHSQTVIGGDEALEFAFDKQPLGSLTPTSDAGGPALGWGGSEFGGSSHSPLGGGRGLQSTGLPRHRST